MPTEAFFGGGGGASGVSFVVLSMDQYKIVRVPHSFESVPDFGGTPSF